MAKGDTKKHSVVFEEGYVHIVFLKDGEIYGARVDFDKIDIENGDLADNEAFDLIRSAWYENKKQ